VIVLDCDNTLWKGVCAEDGPSNVEIDSSYRALQEMMVAQHAAGKLLCLCSKNNERDVFEVFARHQDMPLKREHILAWRINWQPKSANVIALANELQLGMDSFIFVDDSPLECADVQARCPEVLTVQLPAQSEQIPRFLQSVWAFDHLKVTETDRQRTELYRQNRQRESLRQEASTLEDFLASLELEIHIAEMAPDQIERAAQLTQRTNQFNTTTIRRGAGEIRQLAQRQQLQFHVVEVRDRFGDYGLVGLMACEAQQDVLRADTFLLSCRVLGRRVEHQMLREMGKIASARGLRGVTVPFQPTPKNQPALDFLNDLGASRRQSYGQDGWLFTFPVSAISERCDVRGRDDADRR
jgi:FkbH-like protein